jgi:hypothetical protein
MAKVEARKRARVGAGRSKTEIKEGEKRINKTRKNKFQMNYINLA